MKRIDQPDLEPLPATLPEPAAPTCLVGECVEDRHPVMLGRIRVRWSEADETRERWLPTLMGMSVRTGDRVLMMRPDNAQDFIVTGVVDGFAKRPEADKVEAAHLELRPDETIRIAGADGRALLELSQGESGQVVKLLRDDVDLQVPGKLTLRAKEVALRAEEGKVDIKATDDVVVRGEIVRLN